MKQRQFKRIKYKTMRITPWRVFPAAKMRQRQIKYAKLVFVNPSKEYDLLHFIEVGNSQATRS